MSDPEDMPQHPRLALRGSTCWHRATVPANTRVTCPKREATFLQKTKDPREALRRIRVAAVQVDRRLEACRGQVAALASPPVANLSPDQIKAIRAASGRAVVARSGDDACVVPGAASVIDLAQAALAAGRTLAVDVAARGSGAAVDAGEESEIAAPVFGLSLRNPLVQEAKTATPFTVKPL